MAWTKQELASVESLFAQGKTAFEIAEAVGRTPYAVCARLLHQGRIVQVANFDYFVVDAQPWAYGREMQDYEALHRRRPRPARNMVNWDASEVARVAALMDQGKTIFEIAEAVERTPYAVLSRLPRLIRLGDMNYYRIQARPWAVADELKAHRDRQFSSAA